MTRLDLLERFELLAAPHGREAHELRQVRSVDHAVVGHHDEPVHDVAKLAHVAGPVIALEDVHGRVRERRSRLAGLVGDLAREVAGQQKDVVPPLPERRQIQGDDVDPEVEVLAELPLLHEAEKVLVRGRDDPDIHLLRLAAADHAHLAVLEHPEELDLHGGIRLADLVQEDGPAVGGLEEAGPRLAGAREGSLDVAEELALEQPLGDASAVDRHEGKGRPLAAVVDGPGDELLAGAALPGQDDGGRRPGRLVDGGVHRVHHVRLAEQAVACGRRPWRLTDSGQPLVQVVERPPDGTEKLLVREGLGEILVSPGLDGLDGTLDRGVAGDHHQLGLLVVLAHVPDEVHAADLRHLQIRDDELGGRGLEMRYGLRDARGRGHPVALDLEVPAEHLQRALRVVHDENRPVLFAGGHHNSRFSISRLPVRGMRISNVEPSPGALSTLMNPPCEVTMPLTTARPRPVPSSTSFVV